MFSPKGFEKLQQLFSMKDFFESMTKGCFRSSGRERTVLERLCATESVSSVFVLFAKSPIRELVWTNKSSDYVSAQSLKLRVFCREKPKELPSAF